MRPKIGVVMAHYGIKIGWLRQAILSVVCQSMPDWRLYIVGIEGDESFDVISQETSPDPRVVPVVADEPQVYKQRNLGLHRAIEDGCKYTTFFDSDDFMLPSKMIVELSMVELDGLDIGYSSFYYGDEHLNIFRHQAVRSDPFRHEILESCWIPDYSIVDTDFMLENLELEDGTFLNVEKYGTGCIYDYWIRAVEADARFGMNKSPTWIYRYRKDSLGRQLETPQLLDRERVINDAKARWGIDTPTRVTKRMLWDKGEAHTYE